jgi:hypothetical protein
MAGVKRRWRTGKMVDRVEWNRLVFLDLLKWYEENPEEWDKKVQAACDMDDIARGLKTYKEVYGGI